MATEENITTSHSGEPLSIAIYAKGDDGEVIGDAADQVLTLTIGRTAGGDALLTLTGFTLVTTGDEAGTGKYVGVFSASSLTALPEGRLHHYNIWSRLNTDDPILQAYGTLIRQPAINLS